MPSPVPKRLSSQTCRLQEEFLNTLKYVRPGNNFEVNSEITLMQKCNVNGADALPVFKWLKKESPIPCDEWKDTKENGCADPDALVLPRGAFGGSTVVLWSPVARSVSVPPAHARLAPSRFAASRALRCAPHHPALAA